MKSSEWCASPGFFTGALVLVACWLLVTLWALITPSLRTMDS